MKLVAEKAGVSLSTVSRVLNTPESVDDEKVKVVRKWIK
ncbi:MAG: LacI family DNA-binding transcriptional regulator, partial [Cetobacterium sp.]